MSISKKLLFLLECFYDGVYVTVQDRFYVVPIFLDAVVGDAVLEEVVGSDFFRAVPGADQFFSVARKSRGFFLPFFV